MALTLPRRPFKDALQCPVRPEHLDATQLPSCSFNKIEAEVTAMWVVRFCQARGRGWESFTDPEIEGFYNKAREPEEAEEFWWNGMLGTWIQPNGEHLLVSEEFVARYYAAAPARTS